MITSIVLRDSLCFILSLRYMSYFTRVGECLLYDLRFDIVRSMYGNCHFAPRAIDRVLTRALVAMSVIQKNSGFSSAVVRVKLRRILNTYSARIRSACCMYNNKLRDDMLAVFRKAYPKQQDERLMIHIKSLTKYDACLDAFRVHSTKCISCLTGILGGTMCVRDVRSRMKEYGWATVPEL